MTTNLLSNYIHNVNRPVVPQKNKDADVEIVNVKKHKPDFDINRELANRTFIKPLPSKAHLVKSRIFDAPAIFVKDAIYDVKALKDGWNGKANDHQLGKLNDLGMKLGGLGIAAYLFTKKQTPTTKAMEFIGLSSFLASMALWPKFALQLPARLIHGFDVMPQYEDSYGRKKPLYQDPLFIPWDAAYSDEEIHKLGDRWGVPQDIPNRRDFVQEKMRKIALQNNTMWMLTAGFATPIMSALICNAVTKPVTNLLDKYYAKKADNMLVSFSDYADKAKNNNIVKSVETLIELNKEHTIDKNMIESFAMALGKERDMLTVEAIKKDLTSMLMNNEKFTISKELLPKMVQAANDTLLAKFDKSIVDAVVPSAEQLFERFDSSVALNDEKIVRKIFGEELSKDDLLKIFSDFDDLVRENIKKYNEANPNKPLRSDVEIPLILKKLQGKTFESGPVAKVMFTLPSNKFGEDAQTIVRYLAETMTDFTAQGKVLDKYLFTKFGKTSNLSTFWNNVDGSVLKMLNFTNKELSLIKDDRKLVAPMLREKLEYIAADETRYKEVLDKLCQKIAKFSETIKSMAVPKEYQRLTNEVYEGAAGKLREVQVKAKDGKVVSVKMPSLVKELVGFDDLLNLQKTDKTVKAFSQKDIQTTVAEMRLQGVTNTFKQMVNALDMYRRFATLKNIKVEYIDDCKMPLEVMEELIEAAKELQIDAHMADYETKFYTFRNLTPDTNKHYENNLQLKDGKVAYQSLGTGKAVRKVDIPNDPVFFNNLMRLMYRNEMHPDTNDILLKNTIQGMTEHRDAMARDVGDVDYFAKKYHKIFSSYEQGSKATSESKFNRIAKTFNDYIYDAATQKYNTKQWLKLFLTIGGVVMGVTVISQFFFGKMELPKGNKKG